LDSSVGADEVRARWVWAGGSGWGSLGDRGAVGPAGPDPVPRTCVRRRAL